MEPPPGHSLNMIRPDLEGVPQFDLPEPFRLRLYRPGDEQHWYRTHLRSDPVNTYTPETFVRQFGTDAAELARRQYYLCDGPSDPIGTATAWFDKDGVGRVHWVLIVPEYQGRGLAKPMLSTVCNRLRELGHVRVRLGTDTRRLPAVSLYLKFGFVPRIESDEDRAAWRAVAARLPGPPLVEMDLDAL